MIETDRFIIKKLTLDDVGIKYLGWLNNPEITKYLMSGDRVISLDELKDYVLEKISCPEVYFYGIFLKNTLEHIGNIKYEMDLTHKKYFMGILIGEVSWHGKGVAVEAIVATKKFDARVKELYLVVNPDNIGAVKAYKKCGFKKCAIHNFYAGDNKSAVMKLNP